MAYVGSVGHPVLVTIDTNAGSRGIKAATLNATTRNWSAVTTIDPLSTNGAAHLVGDFDLIGNRVIAFQDLSTIQVKYAAMNGLSTWSVTNVISGTNRGAGLAIKLNPLTHAPSVAYFDPPNNSVYYASCAVSPIACATSFVDHDRHRYDRGSEWTYRYECAAPRDRVEFFG